MTTSLSEKTCPYCAETVKSAAIVCRYCERDLHSGTVEAPKETGLVPCDNCGSEILANFKRQTEGFCRDCATAAGILFDSSVEDIPLDVPQSTLGHLDSGIDPPLQSKPEASLLTVISICAVGFFTVIIIGCVNFLARTGSNHPQSNYSSSKSSYSSNYSSASNRRQQHLDAARKYVLQDARAAVREGTWTEKQFEDWTGTDY